MKQQFFLLLSAIILLLSSCSKNDTPATPELLTSFSNGGEITSISYHASKKVNQLTLPEDPVNGGGPVTYTVTYNAAGRMEELSGNNHSTIKLIYQGTFLSKAEIYLFDQLVGRNEYTYENELLKSTSFWAISGNQAENYLKQEYFFNADRNIGRMNVWIKNPLTDQLESGGHVIRTYDKKQSPFSGLGDITLVLWQTTGRNNLIREQYFDADNTPEELIEYTYVYNAKGLPLQAAVKESIPGKEPSTSTWNYTYR